MTTNRSGEVWPRCSPSPGRGGHREAVTYEEAVALVCGLEPDVVLLDLEMPGGTMGPTSRGGRMLALSPPPSPLATGDRAQ